jgi:hypothetical protein
MATFLSSSSHVLIDRAVDLFEVARKGLGMQRGLVRPYFIAAYNVDG